MLTAGLLVPALGASRSGSTPAPAHAVELAALAAGVGWAAPLPSARRTGWFGAVMVAVAAWLAGQSAAFGLRCWMAVVAGCGAAHLAPHGERPRAGRVALAAVGGAAAALTFQSVDARLLPPLGVAAGAALAVHAALRRPAGSARVRLVGAGPALALLMVLTAGVVMWTGANQAQAGWFGKLVAHGPRTAPAVALTFDDGPNVTATLAVRAVLDAYGVKGTFFAVGRAVERRPDIARVLVDDGHLLANHSLRHDAHGWLDPRYPELMGAERVFAGRVGVCPAFFRPPHSQHTPFMAWVARRHGITMVGEDVETADWRMGDPAVVAARILAQVRPGSIIDLHDGLDGDVTTDRTVVVRALPLILDGLDRRGLSPVRLDRLLSRPGYRSRCGR
ncbi:MAG TPA: polysaccharide deacetylase family protein [Acidimicrobiia bacterium]